MSDLEEVSPPGWNPPVKERLDGTGAIDSTLSDVGGSISRPVAKVAVEIEGGTWNAGRHTRLPRGFAQDCEKYNTAVVCGWRASSASSARASMMATP